MNHLKIALALCLTLFVAAPCRAVLLLKQSTAATVKLGPFVDDTDGKTAETALTISQADIRLTKNGGDIAQTNNAAGATHDELGYYDVPLDTTDTNTLGRLRVLVSESGALPVWQDFMVLPANTYDSLVAGSDALNADVDEWNGTAVASPATAGYPAVTIKDGTGTGEIDTASGLVRIVDGTGAGELNTSGGVAEARVVSTARVWFVDDSGSNADGFTPATAFTTLAGAESAATQGDTIIILPGTYSGAHTFSKDGITWQGADAITCIITHNSGDTVAVTGDNCTIRKLTITASAETSNGTALKINSTVGTLIEDCTIDGKFDGLIASAALRPTIRRCNILGTYDAANFTGCRQVRAEDTVFTSSAEHSTDAEFRAVVINDTTSTTIQLSTGQYLFTNCDFRITRTGTSAAASRTVACRAGGRGAFVNCHFMARATNASYTGAVYGLASEALFGATTPFYPGYAVVQGGTSRATTAGSGGAVDLHNSVSEAEIHVNAANYGTSSGAIYNDGPTAVLTWAAATRSLTVLDEDSTTLDLDATTIDLAAGAVDATAVATGAIDADAIAADALGASEIATDAVGAAELAAGAIVKGTEATGWNDPTVADIVAGTWDEPTTGNTTAGTFGAAVQTVFSLLPDSGDQIAGEDAVAAAAVATVDPDVISDSRTWIAQGYRARNIVEVEDGFIGTLALAPDLNDATTINSVSAVSITGAATVTATNLSVDRSRTIAHFTVPALTTTGTYTVKVTVTTVDGQTILTTATLKVQ